LFDLQEKKIATHDHRPYVAKLLFLTAGDKVPAAYCFQFVRD
jgi:hypothetical protein